MGQRRPRQSRINDAEAGADGLDGEVQHPDQHGRDDQGHERARNAPFDLGPHENNDEGGDGDEERPRIERLERARIRVPLGDERGGHRAHLQAEEVADLAREDDQRDAGREPDGHGIGDELDRAAHAHEPEDDEDDSGHQRGDEQPVHPVALHHAGDDHDERARGAADLHPRAPQGGDQEAGDDGGVQAALGGQTTGDRERDGERQRHDADDDAGCEVRRELRAGVALERRDELGNEHGLESRKRAGSR